MKRPDTRAYRLLTKLFLRQFLENDMLSPEGDRSQMLAVVGAAVISLTLFIAVFTSAPYAMTRLSPGEAAVLTLSEKFFFISLAMLVTALVAAGQWDALALDQRDAVILQPLPVRPVALRLAKLTAVAALGAGVAIAVNVFPTLVFPWMVAFAVPRMSAGQLSWMVVTHATITITAATFGYLVVIAIREWTSALLGPRAFARVSPWLQTIAIVLIGSALLLLPLASTQVGRRGFTGWRLLLPPTAYVGAYESLSGGFLNDLSRARLAPRQTTRDRAFTAIYEERKPLLALLSRRAGELTAGVALLVAIATALNAFRTPNIGIAAAPARGRPKAAIVGRILFPRSSAARAGFDFALATIWRSKVHRLTIAAASAIGFAMSLLALSGVDLSLDAAPSARLLSIQPLLYGALLVAFRHVVRVPAELRANWGFQIAWQGQARAFATGVQAAAILTLALPAILAVAPPVAFAGGLRFAAAHVVLGIVGAGIFVDLLMLSYRKVPFTCTYLPGENMKAIVPIFGLAFLIGAGVFARIELGIISGRYTMAGAVALFTLLIVLRIASRLRPRIADVDFNEAPFSLYQLGLHN